MYLESIYDKALRLLLQQWISEQNIEKKDKVKKEIAEILL